MTSTNSLSILWTPWSAAISTSVILLAACLCWTAWRRSGFARSQGFLELIRFSIIVLMAFVLNQPE